MCVCVFVCVEGGGVGCITTAQTQVIHYMIKIIYSEAEYNSQLKKELKKSKKSCFDFGY